MFFETFDLHILTEEIAITDKFLIGFTLDAMVSNVGG